VLVAPRLSPYLEGYIMKFQCPFCVEWEEEQNFHSHMSKHIDKDLGKIRIPGFASLVEPPLSIEEAKRRFQPIGMWNES
jgi:hypothetical protein